MPGYKPPPSTLQQLPDVGMDITLPPTASQRAAAGAAPPAPPAPPAAAPPAVAPPAAAPPVGAKLTPAQQAQMFQDAAAALNAKRAAQDKELEEAMAVPMPPVEKGSTMTVKAPGGSGAPKK